MSGVRPVLTVIEHQPGCPLDRMSGWLDGLEIRTVRPYAGELVPDAPADALVVLGGLMCADDDVASPWLPAVRALMARAVHDRTPTLGICLGAQLLALAGGGTVEVGAAPGRESGVIDVDPRPEAADDALLGGLPRPFAGPSMHADAVTELPAGAVWLASSPTYPHQAFRVGPAAWGVQFHPEVSAATFRGWAEILDDVDTDDVCAQFDRRESEVTAVGQHLTKRFAAVVAGS